MPLQFFTALERFHQAVHDLFFLSRKLIWILRIYGRKIIIQKLIDFSSYRYGPFLVVDLIQKVSSLETKFRIKLCCQSLYFELNNINCLLHFHIQFQLLWFTIVLPF